LDLGLEAFERRLDASLKRPIAVGFSGGGDSLAVLLAAKAWADRRDRPLVALTVDHRLQAASTAWTGFAAEIAARLGIGFRALAWTGDKPASGLPAAARAARHHLLAEAARDFGARVIVLGHTADDILEAEVMRGWGANLGRLREWSPSPAWPQGRGIFLLRPLLDVRRAALRAMLEARGERWIDDPANVDPAQTRARARAALAGGGDPEDLVLDAASIGRLAERVIADAAGTLRLGRTALRAAPPAEARRIVAAAALSVGGGARPPRGDRLEALTRRLATVDPLKVTLCGARIVASDAEVMVVRDAGEAARGGLQALRLAPGEPAVWDGRFELVAAEAGFSVRRLAGLAARLDPAQRRALRAIPPEARPALPAVVAKDGAVSCPILADGPVLAHSLIHDRMRAACGAISKEPAA
jgi:tRNA(Ile)-lysidine synthase